MDLVQEYNKKYEFFSDIAGEAMRVHRKYHNGLLESAYEAALKYLLEQKGMLINFGGESLFSEWYRRDPKNGEIEKIKLL